MATPKDGTPKDGNLRRMASSKDDTPVHAVGKRAIFILLECFLSKCACSLVCMMAGPLETCTRFILFNS